MKMKSIIALLVMTGIMSSFASINAQMEHMGTITPDHTMLLPKDIQWGPAPPGLPPGSQASLIAGDPTAASGSFTIRAKIPANYKVMPHFHPADEHVTVIEGKCYMGMGDNFDEKTATELPTGAFAVMKAGSHHYFFSKDPCIIQVHGGVPWGITYINPADDPR